MLSLLSAMGAQLEDDFLEEEGDNLLQDLGAEYSRLFLGDDRQVSPHESAHHESSNDDSVGDKQKVKAFIESLGIEFKSEYSDAPDHISVELEFMHHLLEEESSAREKNNDKDASGFVDIQRLFLGRHILLWVPAFCDKIIAGSGTSFYREIARVTKHFLDFEKETL